MIPNILEKMIAKHLIIQKLNGIYQYILLFTEQMTAYWSMKMLSKYCMNLFFRDVTVVHKQNVPKQGPTIIYANHNNQFVDGSILVAIMLRTISFIAAAVSCRRKFLGMLLKLASVIPVERPEDIATIGKGFIVKIQNCVVYGKQTHFTKIIKGSLITIKKGPRVKVKQIKSDTELIIEDEGQINWDSKSSYKIIPKLQTHQMFEKVWEGLSEGKCIGIFPQGGSHDQLQIMPFKAGICIMALGAMQKYGKPVTLVPCGFNYYKPESFRSKVIIQFGPAYTIGQNLVQLYRQNKKQAISVLKKQLQNNLKNVTTSMQKFQELQTLFVCRELYTIRSKRKLTPKQILQLNRRFAKGFDQLSHKPENQEFFSKLLQFNQFRKVHQLSIKKERVDPYLITDIIRFLFYLTKFITRTILALPALIFLGPVTTIIAMLANYQQKKQYQSCVEKGLKKQRGIDIVASSKIVYAMMFYPITVIVNSTILYFFLAWVLNWPSTIAIKVSILFTVCMPIYAILFVKSFDSLGRSFKKLSYLFIRLFKRGIFQDFYKKKIELSEKLSEIIQSQAKDVIKDFDSNRIINKQDLSPIHKKKV